MRNKEITVQVSGSLCGEKKRKQLITMLESKRKEGFESINIDMADIKDMDYDGLSHILALRKILYDQGASLHVKNGNQRIRHLLKTLKVEELLGD